MGHQSKKERQSLPCAQQPTLLKGDASGCCKDVLNQYRLLEKGQVALSPFEEGWWVVSDYATHPKQTRGWWENTTCFCWQKQASLPTRRQLCSTSFEKIENKILHWKCWPCNGKRDILNCHLYAIMTIHWTVSWTQVIFLNTGFVSDCVLCSSVYLCVAMNFTGLIFKSRTISTCFLGLAAAKSYYKAEF